MKTLYLLRHAHTVPASPPLMRDHERILSPQGTEDAMAIGRFMKTHEMYPDFVLSSSSVRTIQTSRLIFGELFGKTGVKVASHFDRKFYNASAHDILSEIQMMDTSINRLMMVGHNPSMTQLAFSLGKIMDYAPGTLSVFTADCQSWAEFSPETAKLEKVFVPKA